MSFLKKLKSETERPIYCRPKSLPELVGFEVLRASRIPNKSKPNSMSNVVYLRFKAGLVLQFYPGQDYQSLTKEEIDEFSDHLKTTKWFVVSYGQIGDNVVTKLMDEEDFAKLDLPIFNHVLHKLSIDENPVKRDWRSMGDQGNASGDKEANNEAGPSFAKKLKM